MPKSLRKHRIRSEKWIHFPVRCCRGYGPNQRCARESEPESKPESMTMLPSHLQRLEAESIHILREVAATCSNPVMLYSIGKDSSVMLHLAMKAFYPAKPPFPFLHVDTTWKFK